MNYYLQDSRSYTGNNLMWWAKGGSGYTSNLLLAQVYTRDAAQRQHNARPTDIPWPVDYIQARAQPVVDHQHLNLAEAFRNEAIGIKLTLTPAWEQLERYRCVGCGVFMSDVSRYTAPCTKCGEDNRP